LVEVDVDGAFTVLELVEELLDPLDDKVVVVVVLDLLLQQKIIGL